MFSERARLDTLVHGESARAAFCIVLRLDWECGECGGHILTAYNFTYATQIHIPRIHIYTTRDATAATPPPLHHLRYTTPATPPPLHHPRYTNAATYNTLGFT